MLQILGIVQYMANGEMHFNLGMDGHFVGAARTHIFLKYCIFIHENNCSLREMCEPI